MIFQWENQKSPLNDSIKDIPLQMAMLILNVTLEDSIKGKHGSSCEDSVLIDLYGNGFSQD